MIFSLRCLRGRGKAEECHRPVGQAKCLVLLELVETLGDKPEDVAAKLTSEWSSDTIKRYVSVARKLKGQPDLLQAIVQVEYELGRECALDGIIALRSLTGLNLDEADAVYVVAWLKIFALITCNQVCECMSMMAMLNLNDDKFCRRTCQARFKK